MRCLGGVVAICGRGRFRWSFPRRRNERQVFCVRGEFLRVTSAGPGLRRMTEIPRTMTDATPNDRQQKAVRASMRDAAVPPCGRRRSFRRTCPACRRAGGRPCRRSSCLMWNRRTWRPTSRHRIWRISMRQRLFVSCGEWSHIGMNAVSWRCRGFCGRGRFRRSFPRRRNERQVFCVRGSSQA